MNGDRHGMEMGLRYLACLVSLGGFGTFHAGHAHAADRVQVRSARQVECRWADGVITLDGQAEEPAWSKAQVLEGFYLPWIADEQPLAESQTRARLLWDRNYLYFYADLEDKDLFADVREQDGRTWENDVLELFLKPAADRPGYYEFHVTAAGTHMDMFVPRRQPGFFDRHARELVFQMKSRVRLRGSLNEREDQDQGWSVEGKIPWTDLLSTGGRPNVNETWLFAICRYDYRRGRQQPELSTVAPLKEMDFHRHEEYLPLRFVGPVSETAVRPYGVTKYVPATNSRLIGSPDPPLPYRLVRAYPELQLKAPMFAMIQPGSRQFLLLDQDPQSGKARLVRTTANPRSDELELLLELDSVAYNFAFHPRFATNGYLYIGDNAGGNGTPKKSRVVRYTMSRKAPYRLVPDSKKVIIEWESNGHNGAAVVFGLDGMMYVTSGDGTSDSDTNITGQGLDHLLAKVLRIDVDHPQDGQPYGIPGDNPFVNRPGIRPETWCVGLRNPWRMTVDSKTGHIWVGNNGQDLWEQAYLIKRGANYGWSVYEGGHPFYLQRKLAPLPYTKPTVEHHHREARSLTGGVVYHGSKYPGLQGAYIYGDYSTGKVWAVRHDGKQILYHEEIADSRLAISGFALDADGELLVLDYQTGGGGGFYQLQPVPTIKQANPFPRRLSETGLFASVKGHRVTSALIPYSVNAPLWSDGAIKSRFIALPEADSRIVMTKNKAWQLPEKTVLVKSFGLEMEPGKATSQQWIETRLMTLQQGEWVGYSYAWNEQQTEAHLVGRDGLDRTFSLKAPDGIRKQVWHYPSRSECMVCHSRAANYVLGVSTRQLNKVHDYGEVRDHQFRTLEHLGLFRTSWRTEAVERYRQELAATGLDARKVKEQVAKVTSTPGQRKTPAQTTLLFHDPSHFGKLVDPYSAGAPLDERVRSYLHSNCAQCHVNAGGGNSQINLEYHADFKRLKAIGEPPLHDRFGLKDAKIIDPGNPLGSTLFLRVARRGRGQMPQLGTNVVDQQAVELLRAWIQQLPPSGKESEDSDKSD